jgi:hypothetical protein
MAIAISHMITKTAFMYDLSRRGALPEIIDSGSRTTHSAYESERPANDRCRWSEDDAQQRAGQVAEHMVPVTRLQRIL